MYRRNMFGKLRKAVMFLRLFPQEIRNIYWLKNIELRRLLNLANAILDLHVTFSKGLWAVVTQKTYIENISYVFQLGSILCLINKTD